MSELSTMLGDVYNDRPEPSPGSGLPDWADEGVLDAAFADWIPGPPETAPAAERSILTDLAAGPEPVPPVTLPNLAPAPLDLSEAPLAPLPAALAAAAAPPAPRGWRYDDDDILPVRTRAQKVNFRIR